MATAKTRKTTKTPTSRKRPRPAEAAATAAEPRSRTPVVKTATRKAAATDPRAARVAARQRRLQDQEKAKDARAAKKAAKSTTKKATQAGPRRQPEKMPAEQLAKPGNEHAMQLAPRVLAPDYPCSGKLNGKRAITKSNHKREA